MARQQHQTMMKGRTWALQRQCGKTPFPSKRAAQGRARVLGLGFYHCQTCHKWHLGHSRRP